MLIPPAYSQIVASKGRPLADIGVNESGLVRTDALSAIEALRGSNVPILGGDVLKMVEGTPRYTYDNWYCDRRTVEDLTAFLQRSWDMAESYVRAYKDPEDGTILYVLVVSELSA